MRITRGPLLSLARLRDILLMNTQALDALIDRDAITIATGARIHGTSFGAPPSEGTRWDDPRHLVVRWAAIEISLDGPPPSARNEVSLRGGFRYELGFYAGRRRLWTKVLRLPRRHEGELELVTVEVPRRVLRSGFDRMRLSPVKGTSSSALGTCGLSLGLGNAPHPVRGGGASPGAPSHFQVRTDGKRGSSGDRRD